MQTKPQKSKKRKDLYLLEDNKKVLILGSIIATFLAITPFLFNLYQSVPEQRIWDTFLFTYDSGFWEDANYAMWVLTSKLIPLILLLIWFFTNRHWWFHALLVPIFMYIYQIILFFNDTSKFIDEFQFLYMLPVMAIVIPSIYLIRARMFNRINEVSKTMEELEAELKMSPRNFWQKIKQYF